MKKRKVDMKEYSDIRKEWLKDPEVKRKYDELQLQYDFLYAIMDNRIKKGLTQKELAKKAGTTQSSIARFESGEYNSTLSFVKKLADALGIVITVKATKV